MLKVRIGNINSRVFEDMETYFRPFRMNTIGINQYFQSPYGRKKIIYADWMASGRLYSPIESKLIHEFGPFVANPHTESNITGIATTFAYKQAKDIIKHHVNADEHDVIIMDGSGMTSVINKLQRILGLRLPEQLKQHITIPEEDRPVIFITHREHHSNHISWLETIGEVVCLQPDSNGNINLRELERMLQKYRHRKFKIGSFTACSNVTGIQTPYQQMARIMHKHGGICLVDFSASAPYVEINMHPGSPLEKLDGIFFSPHKFLGGPGTSGVLIFDSRLYSNRIPDHPGGGTVAWTNPWGQHSYHPDVEAREDGGTPGFLQAIKTALCVKLKEQMGVRNLLKREKELKDLLLNELLKIPELHVFESSVKERLGIISFHIENIHYNLAVKLLNDRFGIQCRGGCSCAGPYGHYLLDIDQPASKLITDQIDKGDLSSKPGWIRISVHPIMTNSEIHQIITAIKMMIKNIDRWKLDYAYSPETNEFYHLHDKKQTVLKKLFDMKKETPLS